MVPTAPFNVAMAWTNGFKIDFVLSVTLCILVLIQMFIKHKHLFDYICIPETAGVEEVDNCKEWCSYLYMNQMLAILLCGNLYSLAYTL